MKPQKKCKSVSGYSASSFKETFTRIICALYLILTGCMPVYYSPQLASLEEEIPKTFFSDSTRVMIIPVVNTETVVHVTQFDSTSLKHPMFPQAKDLKGLESKFRTKTIGYFTFIGTVHGTTNKLEYLVVISADKDLLIMRGYDDGWSHQINEKLSKKKIEELIEIFSSQKSINFGKVFFESSYPEDKIKIQWNKNDRKRAVSFLRQ